MNFNDRIQHFFHKTPTIDSSVYVAPGAVILGDVTIEKEASVWFHAVARGDINRIHIGAYSNIQDGSVIHVADDFPTIIGQYVTCGHKAILHACTIADEVLIGMNATILDGVEIGPRCIIGANALVTTNTKIPEGSLVLGSPAKIIKTLDHTSQQSIKEWADRYVILSRKYLERVNFRNADTL